MKYAVIKTGGKQYKVSEGDILEVERLQVKPEEKYVFPVLLFVAEGAAPMIGKPTLSDVVVTGKVLEETKGDKIRVAKYKAKVRYRKVIGHRQQLSKVKIEEIALAGKKSKTVKKKT